MVAPEETPIPALGECQVEEPLCEAKHQPSERANRWPERSGNPLLRLDLGRKVLMNVEHDGTPPDEASDHRRRDQLRIVDHRDPPFGL